MNNLSHKLVLLVAILTCGALTGCATSFGQQTKRASPSKDTIWNKPASGVTLVAQLRDTKSARFDPVTPIIVDLTLKNISKKPVVFTETFSSTDYDIIAKDRAGTTMPVTRYGYKHRAGEVPASSATRQFALQPGKTRQFTIVVNRMVDMSLDDSYEVAIRRFIGFKYVQSNVLKIDVNTISP